MVFLPPILGLAVADLVRDRRAGDGARVRATLRSVGLGLVIAALLFLPLVVNELTTGFQETQRVLDFLGDRGGAGGSDPFGRFAITLFRVVGWPLVGLVTNAPAGSILTVTVAIVLSAWLMLAGRGTDRSATRWLGLSVLWSAAALTILAPSLESVVPALPNDHYHSFLDPVVIVLVALAARAIAVGTGPRQGVDVAARAVSVGTGPRQGVDVAARAVVGLAVAALVVLDAGLWPPADPNGGWPAARAAGERIIEIIGSPVDVRQLPVFKTAEGVGYPVIAAGGRAFMATDSTSALQPIVPDAMIVIACDRLFEDVIGNACGGPAETSYLSRLIGESRVPDIVTRFPLSPRIVISIYKP